MADRTSSARLRDPVATTGLIPRTAPGWLLLAAYAGLAALASLTGTVNNDAATRAWNASLNQPPWEPPSWTFGVVWPILYLLMAYAGWRADSLAIRPTPLRLAWGLQIALNASWTLVFFGLHAIVGGFVVILALFAAIALWMMLAARVDRLAAWLFLPYLAWVGFASTLNGYYVVAN